jgi:hypothetical protein
MKTELKKTAVLSLVALTGISAFATINQRPALEDLVAAMEQLPAS